MTEEKRRVSLVRATSVRDTPVGVVVSDLLASDDPIAYDQGHEFLTKVWVSVALQWALVIAICAFIMYVEPIKKAVEGVPEIPKVQLSYLEVAVLLSLIPVVLLVFKFGQVFPWNLVLLVTFTVLVAVDFAVFFAAYWWGPIGLLVVVECWLSFAAVAVAITGRRCFRRLPKWHMWKFMAFAELVTVASGFLAWTFLPTQYLWSLCGAVPFTAVILYGCGEVTHSLTAKEHFLATLFILMPELLMCLPGPKKREKHEEVLSTEQMRRGSIQESQIPNLASDEETPLIR